MREFQNKKYIGKLLYSKYTIVLLLILIVITAKAVFGAYEKHRKSEIVRDLSAFEVKNLLEREVKLDSDLMAIDSDEGKEREIRKKFGFVKEGEKLIVIVENTTTTTPVPQQKGFWDKLFDFFR